MRNFTFCLLTGSAIIAASAPDASAAKRQIGEFNPTNYMYRIDSPSVFHNSHAKETNRINGLVSNLGTSIKKTAAENPQPIGSLPAATASGNIDAPNGELWYYTGSFIYKEIPPHDNVMYTDRILQEYTFDLYDSDMKYIGSIKDKMDYADNEVRVVTCDLTPVATRNFFNTDDDIELAVALAVNIEGGGNNYRTLIYSLASTPDAEGCVKPIDVMDDFISDVIEGPASADGSENYYVSFMRETFNPGDDYNPESFWDFLLAQTVSIDIYGKAIDDKGPRLIEQIEIPTIQLPGDQQDIPAIISMRRGDKVIFSISYYKLPFFNEYQNPFSDDMTMREGNSLMIDLYYAAESGLSKFSTTEIAMELDPMKDSAGNSTALFSYYGVGSLNFTRDFLFDAPGASEEKPDFVITVGNYQVSTDDIVNSYFTYKNDGTLKNTLWKYADGTLAMGNIEGFEPQQLFVSQDRYGYVYNFVDLYSAKTSTVVPADYYTDDDADPELLMSNVARTPVGDSYNYVFEMRYPLTDDDENDLLRFMHIDRAGKYVRTDMVNMGKGVMYAQSYLNTEALAPNVFSKSDAPTYMCLIKRGVVGSNIEQLLIAEAETEENPEGKTLLLLGPNDNGALASIVPEFPTEEEPGRLFVYYYSNEANKYALDIYALPIGDNSDSGVENFGTDLPGIAIDGSAITAAGEIRVFNMNGQLVASGIDAVEFASLEKGVYVVVAAGKSYKIVK